MAPDSFREQNRAESLKVTVRKKLKRRPNPRTIGHNPQFSQSVMSDSATAWIAAPRAFLSITSSRSLLKLMSIKSVMPSKHLIFYHLLPPHLGTQSYLRFFLDFRSSTHVLIYSIESCA